MSLKERLENLEHSFQTRRELDGIHDRIKAIELKLDAIAEHLSVEFTDKISVVSKKSLNPEESA